MARRDIEDEETSHPRPRLLAMRQTISRRMEELGLTGAKVARQAGISARQFNYYANGERSPDLITAKKIASILRTTLDDLVDPKSFLTHRDERTYAALQRFHEICTELEPVDVGTVAEFAEFMAERRLKEAEAGVYFGARIPPVCERLMRVHHILVPAILGKFATARLDTDVFLRDDEKLWVVISLEFSANANRQSISNEIVALATRRLGLGKDEVRPMWTDPKLISVDICLGPDPSLQTQKPAAPPRKRPYQARGLPSLSARRR